MSNHSASGQMWERAGGVGVAALGVVVLAVAGAALRHPQTRQAAATVPPVKHTSAAAHPTHTSVPTHPPTTAPATPSPTPTPTPTPTPHSAKMPLIVLNNTYYQGMATQAANLFRAGGWPINYVGSLQNNILSSAAYYDPAVPGAQQAAQALQAQFPAIKRVVARFPQLPQGPVVVVLTTDYLPTAGITPAAGTPASPTSTTVSSPVATHSSSPTVR